ncbi:MAG: hypothetical protein KGK33_02630 [Hyphomicrobiales bacterium]|nr:hypothetical protein [Hyphomicrobiales bacterium]MDE2283493.1 hypothetical protein [Hyphomicrobiales bacterium]
MSGIKWYAPRIVGAVALLAAIGAVFFGSYRTTTNVGANLRAAGIHLQSMHPWHPAAHPPG